MITLPRTQTSLSLDENVRAKEGGKETKGEMYPSHGNLRFSPVTRVCRSPLSLVIHSHHNLHNLYLVVSAVFIVVFRLSRCGAHCWKITNWKVTSLSHTVYTSPPKITVMPSSFSTFKMPARGVPSRQWPLAWERATSDYVDIFPQETSLQETFSMSLRS